jgi:hypothetical protein
MDAEENEDVMRTHRFGRKLKLPATIAIKHQIRKLMLQDLLKEAEDAARAESIRALQPENDDPSILDPVEAKLA